MVIHSGSAERKELGYIAVLGLLLICVSRNRLRQLLANELECKLQNSV